MPGACPEQIHYIGGYMESILNITRVLLQIQLSDDDLEDIGRASVLTVESGGYDVE